MGKVLALMKKSENEIVKRKFDPEVDEQLVPFSEFKLMKFYKYEIIIESGRGEVANLFSVNIRFPLTPDDFIELIVSHHANNLGWSIEKLKDQFHHYFSENGGLYWQCEETNERACMITYLDYFSDERYGQANTLLYFDGEYSTYSLMDEIKMKIGRALVRVMMPILTRFFISIESLPCLAC